MSVTPLKIPTPESLDSMNMLPNMVKRILQM